VAVSFIAPSGVAQADLSDSKQLPLEVPRVQVPEDKSVLLSTPLFPHTFARLESAGPASTAASLDVALSELGTPASSGSALSLAVTVASLAIVESARSSSGAELEKPLQLADIAVSAVSNAIALSELVIARMSMYVITAIRMCVAHAAFAGNCAAIAVVR
jgi:hypothetical protein